ncbi:hypothetical protein [Rathayibacter iranicus]|uniref:hypothetical protein n=1 Tax=Rathayibacter iranicus TaxID=59737 RepID=UPI000CE91B79|nr:hypothetical protein [Rathayibacter iranicus]PPI50385.1 hypothetical protein C5E09_02050 [Rathayibacter iranicus]
MQSHLRRRHLPLSLMSLLLVLTALSHSATPATAEDDERARLPLAAGSTIWTDTGGICTVGAVFKRTGWGANASRYTASFRYLVTAKHCAPEIGRVYSVGNMQVGIVTWVSPTEDVEFVQVPPEVTRTDSCFSSQACFLGSIIAPRAIGRVWMAVHGRLRAIPMRYRAVPGADERFCTSGVISGVNCNWVLEEDRPPDWPSMQGQIARSLNAIGVQWGDSGGPVIGADGELYGIIQKLGLGGYRYLMQYLPIETVMSESDYLYEIAPS